MNTSTATLQSRLKIVLTLGGAFLAGSVGALATGPAVINWYPGLSKPFFSPPDWVFAPVWIVLYILMGIAAYLVWREKSKLVPSAMSWYWIQLALSATWSLFFFGLKNPLLALGEIVVLWWAIFMTARKFSFVSNLAAMLMLPYLAWVSFATILNLSIVILN